MRNNVTWNDLVACARRVGVEVIEAPSSHRGKKGTMGSVRGVACHHTGTANSYKPAEEYPDYNVVKEGRTGLLNSLSAFGIGRWRAIFVFSEFLSWHAGEWNWKGITDGNGDFLGIECAGVGDYTPFQRKVYPRLVAALLLFLGEGIDMAPRHADGAMPRGRKTDAAKFDTAFHDGMNFYDSVKFFMANPTHININFSEGDDMGHVDTISDKAIKQIKHALMEAPVGGIRDDVGLPRIKGTGDVEFWQAVSRVVNETSGRLGSRVPGSDSSDTVLGFAANADAYGHAIVKELTGLRATVDLLVSKLGEDGQVDVEEFRTMLREELPKLDVVVSVDRPASGA